jgi:ClpP class serine protease
VKRVLFDFDSPGGSISGLPETAQIIAQLGKEKDTFGFTEGQCQSAAYWLMSQCNHLYATESSFAGSVGIYLAVYDRTQAMENEGVKLTLIKAGKHKGAGIPGNPLSPDEIAMLQKQVDMIYASFTSAITAKRPKVTSETMQGQSFYGTQILQAKLIDAMATGLGQLVAALS